MLAFDASTIAVLTQFLIIDCKALNFSYWGITTNHWGITTSLVVIPQSNPLNFPCTGIQIYIYIYIYIHVVWNVFMRICVRYFYITHFGVRCEIYANILPR